MPTLAQVLEPPIPSVAPTPFVESWLTGSGVLAAGALALAAVAAFLLLARAKPRLAVPTTALLLAGAVAALVVGRLVVTPRETLRARARSLVAAAVTADKAALAPLLHPDARVQTRFADARGRDNILPLTDRAAPLIRSHTVREVRVDLRGPQVARTQVRLSIQSDAVPPASWWAVDWQKTTPDAPWTVTHIEPIWIQGVSNP